MLDVIPVIEGRWHEILNGRLFDDESNPGSQVEMHIFPMGLQSKRFNSAQGHDYPFTEISVRGGTDQFGKSTFFVDIVAGFWVYPDVDGDGDIDQDGNTLTQVQENLMFLIKGFRKLQNIGSYSPYSLESMKWQIGDENGDQPVTGHYLTAAVLEFQQEPIF